MKEDIYHEPRGIEAKKGEKPIKENKEHGMQIAADTLFPLPR